MPAITTAEGFEAAVKPGDTFWHLTSYCGVPMGVLGPRQLTQYDSGGLAVIHDANGEFHLHPATFRQQGAFTDEHEAQLEYQRRIQLAASDPANHGPMLSIMDPILDADLLEGYGR